MPAIVIAIVVDYADTAPETVLMSLSPIHFSM